MEEIFFFLNLKLKGAIDPLFSFSSLLHSSPLLCFLSILHRTCTSETIACSHREEEKAPSAAPEAAGEPDDDDASPDDDARGIIGISVDRRSSSSARRASLAPMASSPISDSGSRESAAVAIIEAMVGGKKERGRRSGPAWSRGKKGRRAKKTSVFFRCCSIDSRIFFPTESGEERRGETFAHSLFFDVDFFHLASDSSPSSFLLRRQALSLFLASALSASPGVHTHRREHRTAGEAPRRAP